MAALAGSFRTCAAHTGRYYARLFEPLSVKVFAVAIAALIILASVTVTHAAGDSTLLKWAVEDVLDEAILTGRYDYALDEDAPDPSDNDHHLQMPMMMESFVPPDTYISEGGDPENPKIDDQLTMTMKPSIVGDDFKTEFAENYGADDYDEAFGGSKDLITDRPPHSGLG